MEADDRDEEDRTPLMFAAGYNEANCVEVLLGAGANVDAVDKNDNTACHYAAGYGSKEALKKLVDSGASCTKKNKDGNTPLEVSRMNKQQDVESILTSDVFL